MLSPARHPSISRPLTAPYGMREGRERAATHGYRPLWPPRQILRFGPMIGTFKRALSVEREPKTDERRTANDGPLSIPFLSRIVPGGEGGAGRCAPSGRVGALRGKRGYRLLSSLANFLNRKFLNLRGTSEPTRRLAV
jgi:hypothetical protein